MTARAGGSLSQVNFQQRAIVIRRRFDRRDFCPPALPRRSRGRFGSVRICMAAMSLYARNESGGSLHLALFTQANLFIAHDDFIYKYSRVFDRLKIC